MSLKKLATVFRLPLREKILIPAAYCQLLKIKRLSRNRTFPQVLCRVKEEALLRERDKPYPVDPYRIGWLVDRLADVLGPGYNCLPRALAVYVLCRRRGCDVIPKIGTRRVSPGSPFEAHAWVEYGEDIIIGYLPGIQLFKSFDELGANYL